MEGLDSQVCPPASCASWGELSNVFKLQFHELMLNTLTFKKKVTGMYLMINVKSSNSDGPLTRQRKTLRRGC